MYECKQTMEPVVANGQLSYAPEGIAHFDCPVCMCAIEKHEIKVISSCGHTFCENCVVRTQNTRPYQGTIPCPMCRCTLNKLAVRLEKIPLRDVRKKLSWQQYTVASLERTISTAEERIHYYQQMIDHVMNESIRANSVLQEEKGKLAVLEDQVQKRKRERTRRVVQEGGGGGDTPVDYVVPDGSASVASASVASASVASASVASASVASASSIFDYFVSGSAVVERDHN